MDDKLKINRAKTIAVMGMVEADFEGFNVTSPGVRKETYRVWRDENERTRCSCREFGEANEANQDLICEHILAVKYHLELCDEKPTLPDEPQDEFHITLEAFASWLEENVRQSEEMAAKIRRMVAQRRA